MCVGSSTLARTRLLKSLQTKPVSILCDRYIVSHSLTGKELACDLWPSQHPCEVGEWSVPVQGGLGFQGYGASLPSCNYLRQLPWPSASSHSLLGKHLDRPSSLTLHCRALNKLSTMVRNRQLLYKLTNSIPPVQPGRFNGHQTPNQTKENFTE